MTLQIRVIQSSDIGGCPKRSMLVAHYRDDGSCRCDERQAALDALTEARDTARWVNRLRREAAANLRAAEQRVREC